MKSDNLSLKVLLVCLTLFLITETLFSLSWRLKHDTALLQFVAFQMVEHGKLPYTDIFDINLPGTHLFHVMWIKMFGLSDLGFRIIDLIWSVSILSLVFVLLKKHGKFAGWITVVVIGLYYMAYSPTHALQRDWIMMLPILGSVLLTTNSHKFPVIILLFIGILAGFVFLMKPHALIYLIPLYIFYRKNGCLKGTDRVRGVYFIASVTIGLLGLVLPFIIVLSQRGQLNELLSIIINYWHLHAELSGGHYVLSGFNRLRYIAEETFRFGGNLSWVLAALFGCYVYFNIHNRDETEDELIKLYAGLAIAFALFTASSGQFWWYHWLPSLVFTAMLLSATLFNGKSLTGSKRSYIPVAVLVVCLLTGSKLPVSGEFFHQVSGKGVRAANNGRADQIAEFLKKNLEMGDAVQPLDWTGGGVHSCLIAGADLATKYVCDAQFYHHIDDSYIKYLQFDFIDQLRLKKPRFIIDIISEDKPWPLGNNTMQKKFKALELLIERCYTPFDSGDGYTILERMRRTDSEPVNWSGTARLNLIYDE